MGKTVIAGLGLLAACCGSCRKELLEYGNGDLKVRIEQGGEWLHDFPLFWGIVRKNPPQIAVWIEDERGTYLSSVYVSHKAATQAWQMAGGNRRKEALPHWCHSRGIRYEDGLYMPTEDSPLTDGISGATPRSGFSLKLVPEGRLKRFTLKAEVNHSADFNDSYPESAGEGERGYSGGRHGSGQPALVYAAEVDLTSGRRVFEAALLGHSSPDGSTGDVYPDVSGITTALGIVERITVEVR